MITPLDPQAITQFAQSLSCILVVEDGQAFIEPALKQLLYDTALNERPRILSIDACIRAAPSGQGSSVGVADYTLDAGTRVPTAMNVAEAIASGLLRMDLPDEQRLRLETCIHHLAEHRRRLTRLPALAPRTPTFCAGCPHSMSTKIPSGSVALGGLGCHQMAVGLPDRHTVPADVMGVEGLAWIGQAPFCDTQHVFANLGDGTYFHSGSLVVRAAVAARINITYKILYNDAIAITGGQHVDGALSVPDIAWQMAAEGVRQTVIVTDHLDNYGVIESGDVADRHAAIDGPAGSLPSGIRVFDRQDLDQVQRDLKETPGCTVLIYDQTCAIEKRRRARRRNTTLTSPASASAAQTSRLFINEAVCEGCGDCSEKSSCSAIEPVDHAVWPQASNQPNNVQRRSILPRGLLPKLR